MSKEMNVCVDNMLHRDLKRYCLNKDLTIKKAVGVAIRRLVRGIDTWNWCEECQELIPDHAVTYTSEEFQLRNPNEGFKCGYCESLSVKEINTEDMINMFNGR